MKHLEDFVKNIEYAKHMYKIYGDYTTERLGNDLIFFKTFIGLGFENMYSYYSVVVHERYLKIIGTKKCFIWRDGNNYKIEFSSHDDVLRLCKILDSDIPVKQLDSLTIELKYISKSIILQINEVYFK